jgi:hypothetical protein
MTKVEPLPLIGVRGSETAISAPKAVIAGGVALLVGAKSTATVVSPLSATVEHGLQNGLDNLKKAVRASWETGNGKMAAAALAGMAVFGKAIDKRFKGFPIKFGR